MIYILLGETFYIYWLTKELGILSLETELAGNTFMIEKREKFLYTKYKEPLYDVFGMLLFILMLGEDILSSLNINW